MVITEHEPFSGKDYSERLDTTGEALAYFGKLPLSDIYGRDHPQPLEVPITREQYNRWSDRSIPSEELDAEKLAFAKQHGLSGVGTYGRAFSRDGFAMIEFSTRELTQWMPSLPERQLIIWLAKAVKGNSDVPQMIEVGHGSGIVAKVFGVTKEIVVIGFDTEEKIMDRYDLSVVPDIPDWVRLFKADIWDQIKLYDPKFTPETDAKRQSLLEAVRGAGPSFYEVEAVLFSGQYGDPRRLNSEIATLQALVHERTTDSPVDVVLCSFMATESELTVPIRDGIYPKAIVYIKPVEFESKAGAGDFDKPSVDPEKLDRCFEDIERSIDSDDDLKDDTEFDLEAEINPNSHISFHPGKNYEVVARWPTTYANIHYDQSNLFHPLDLGFEVIIQLRKDVRLADIPFPGLERFPFDDDIEFCLAKGDQLQRFRYGVEQARQSLLKLM